MASHSNGVSYDLKRKAHNWCKQYLAGSWKKVSLDEFDVEVLGGGLTNKLYICSLPVDYPVAKTEPRRVVLRVYGALYSDLVSTPQALVSDIIVFALLSERNIGPKLYAIFPEGRLEELLQARNLSVIELTYPMNSIKIARKMAEFHQLELPLCKEPNFMWDTMLGWCEYVDGLHFNEQPKAAKLAKIRSINLRKEFSFLRNYLETATLPGPVTFCHNDFQEGNILAVSHGTNGCEKDSDFQIIDFEYSAYNYRAFDIANHFCEWFFDYTAPHPPYFTVSDNAWPSRDQVLLFIRAYLGKTVDNKQDFSNATIEETELLAQVDRFSLASHFLWGLWGVVQESASSDYTPLDYLEYAMKRFEAYQYQKKVLGLV